MTARRSRLVDRAHRRRARLPRGGEIDVEQVRRTHVLERVEHDGADLRVRLLQLRDELVHRDPLEALLRAAEVARQNRERLLARELDDVRLGALDERADDVEPIVVGPVLVAVIA